MDFVYSGFFLFPAPKGLSTKSNNVLLCKAALQSPVCCVLLQIDDTPNHMCILISLLRKQLAMLLCTKETDTKSERVLRFMPTASCALWQQNISRHTQIHAYEEGGGTQVMHCETQKHMICTDDSATRICPCTHLDAHVLAACSVHGMRMPHT
jgi:hypothetical protein